MDSQEQSEKHPFSLYEEVNKRFSEYRRYNFQEAIKTENNFIIQPLDDNLKFIGFTYFAYKDFEEKDMTKEGKIFLEYGLKFHISLPEWNKELYKKGCDIVAGILMEEGVSFKYIKSFYKMSEESGQAGKDITIFARFNPDKDVTFWSKLLIRTTRALMKAKIPPGYRVQGTNDKPEKPVTGSNYVTYRYENELKTKLGWPQPDPATFIEVPVKKQPNFIEFNDNQNQSGLSFGNI